MLQPSEASNQAAIAEEEKMPLVFWDKIDKDAHDKFQNWRRGNDGIGLFINVKTAKRGMLHKVLCAHPGNTDFSDESQSLTRKRKVCSTSRKELERWAEENSLMLTACSDCRP
jgi:hypothetical protein